MGQFALPLRLRVLPGIVEMRRRLTAFAFGLVERRVRAAQQRRRFGAVGRRLGDSDARPGENRGAVQHGRSVKAFRHLARPALGVIGVGSAADDHHELIAADTRDRLSGADGSGQPARNVPQQLVPGLVTEAIVDCLEAVEVQTEQREPFAVMLEPVERGAERGFERRTVRQPGERVVQCSGFGSRLRDHAIGELTAMRKRRPKQDHHIGEQQQGNEILGAIVSAMDKADYKTVTLVAGLRLRGLTAAKTFDGPINAALFEDWLETCLVPTLSPGEIVVMDNLPAHKGPRVEQLIKAAGAELRYLPAYSPDMNPIEKAFSKLKAFLRKIAERAAAGLMRALETCAETFKPSQCTNYFKSCGYEHDTG